MQRRLTQKNRFRPEVLALEARNAPAPAATVIPSVLLVGANVRDFHGAQNACPGIDNAASHNNNPVLEIQDFRHACTCDDGSGGGGPA